MGSINVVAAERDRRAAKRSQRSAQRPVMAMVSGITQGRTLASVAAGGAVVHEVAYAPGAFMPVHAHRRANVTLVLGGSVDDEAEGELFRAAALSLVFKPSSVEHRTSCGARGLRTLVIELDEGTERRLRGALGVRRCTWVTGGELVRATVRLWAGLRMREARPRELLDAWLAALPEAEALRAEPPVSAVSRDVSAALAMLRASGGAGIGTAELARALKLHPCSVTRLFVRTLGTGVMARARRERVRQAAERLGASDEPMARIAAAGGFADQSHLCRDFKRETGVSPGRYRALVRGPALRAAG